MSQPDKTELTYNINQALTMLHGNQTLLKKCMEYFLTNTPQVLDGMAASLEQGDSTAMRHAAHSLKSELKYLGAPTAAETAYQLEKMATQGELNGGELALQQLRSQCNEIRSAGQQWLDQD